MTYGRAYHTASILSDGKVLVVDGDNSKTLNSSELYDPSTGNWTRISDLKILRADFAATSLLNGKVLATGGMGDDEGGITNTAELYDPSTNNWTHVPHFKRVRMGHTATLLRDGRVLIIGGEGDACEKTTEIYDPSK